MRKIRRGKEKKRKENNKRERKENKRSLLYNKVEAQTINVSLEPPPYYI